MSWFTNVVSGGVDKVVDSVANGLDSLFTSDDERNKAKIILEKNMQDFKIELENKALEYDKEVTERWKSDNEHTITRLVRPAIVIWSMFVFTVALLFDGNVMNFHINEAYIPLLETIVTTSIVAYMGMRTFDKHSKNKHKGN